MFIFLNENKLFFFKFFFRIFLGFQNFVSGNFGIGLLQAILFTFVTNILK